MTTVDWIIVAVAAAAAVFGYRQGFLVGALSLAGFALGAFAGTRLAPLVLPQGAQSPYATLFGLLAVEIAVTMKDQGLKTGIGIFFFIVALIFVYRSFYGMRIPEEATSGKK